MVKEINNPRLPSLRGTLASKKAQITKFTQADLGIEPSLIGLKGSPTCVKKIFTPPQRKGGVKLSSKPEESSADLAQKLRELKII